MSDIRDGDVDDLEIRLTRALRHEADAHDPTAPAAATIRTAARRRDRRRQVEIGSALLVAAALLVVLIVGPWRNGDDGAYVDSVPSGPKPALHLVLDEAAGYEILEASEHRLDADGRPPGTVPGPEGRSTHEHILFGGADPLTPPWLLLSVRTMENPTGPWGGTHSNEQATTVGGRPAVLRSYGVNPGDSTWTWIALKWDEHHEVNARFWGITPDAAAAAVATLHQDGTGRWTLGEPPPGLQDVARDEEGSGAGWYRDSTSYQDPSIGSMPIPAYLTVTRTDAPRSEADLVARVLGSSYEQATTIERTTVRGQPALLVRPGPIADANVGPQPNHRVVWFEPEHDVVVDLVVYESDRAQADRAIANLREVSDADWRTTLATCTGVSYAGTIASVPSWASGGPCPGFEQVGG